MKKHIRRSFEAAAPTYDAAAVIQRQVARRCAALCPDALSTAQGRAPRVLEIGSGAGALTRLLLEKYHAQRYFALDLAMSAFARVSPKAENLLLLSADGEAAPFAPQSMDLLVSSSCMQWYLTPERSIPQNLSLLHPGGAFALALFVKGTFKELWRASESTGFGSVFPLRDPQFYVSLFHDMKGLEFETAREEAVALHDSVPAFLKSHRQTGARYTGSARGFSRKRYEAFCNAYREQFERQGKIPATYSICYIWGRKT